MTAAVGGHLSLMSCVREPSPQDNGGELETERHGGSKKKFWNPRKWFKRKSNKVAEDITSGTDPPDVLHAKDNAIRSLSTSELSITDEPVKRKSSGGVPLHPGLSVSHDSVFHSPHSGSESELDGAQSSSSLFYHHNQPLLPDTRLQTELSERIRSRRGRCDTSEDDEGLPRSPCNSPTAAEVSDKNANKDHPTKSHSTCSDGSLLSMGSSEMDEDSFGQQSRHSSKLSLHDSYIKRTTSQDSEPELELGVNNISAPLNHSAAHHRVAVRPKRTHGAPRRKKATTLAAGTILPTTPEVNEDISIRSSTPEVSTREIVAEHYTSAMSKTKSMTAGSSMLTETQLKCSSLPPGLAGPGSMSNRLNRSKSNAGSKSQDPLEEGDEAHEEKKKEDSFFGRFFGRQSGKKKKSKEETGIKISTSQHTFTSKTETVLVSTTTSKPIEDRRPYSVDPFMIRTGGLIKTGPSSRQRVQPIDIPVSPDLERQRRSPELQAHPLPPKSPEKPSYVPAGLPPLHAKLEQHFRQRNAASTSPPKQQEPLNFFVSSMSPPKSLWATESSATTKTITSSSTTSMRFFESRLEENRSKVKIAGLSSLQQRVMAHNDCEEDERDSSGFKSLTDFPPEPEVKKANVTKSHSFKSVIKPTATDSINPCVLKTAMKTPVRDDPEENLDSISSVGASKDAESSEYTIKAEVASCHSMSMSLDSIEDNVGKAAECKRSASNENVYSNHTKHFKSDNEQTSTREITINSVPVQHTSIVNISAAQETKVVEKPAQQKEQPMITKIQVKRESTVPEFFNVQLNKVDTKPSTTVVLSTSASITSPVIVEEKTKLKDQKEQKPVAEDKDILVKRKFSAENMEIIDKEPVEETIDVPSKSPSANRMFKKLSETTNQFNVHQRKSSLVSINGATSNPESPTSPSKPFLKKKSNSLEVVEIVKKVLSETAPPAVVAESVVTKNGLDKSDSTGSVKERMSSSPDIIADAPVEVVLRRKSLAKQRQDDEPELMKVFARRSLKLKDSDVEALNQQVLADVKAEEEQNSISISSSNGKSRDSDKENDAAESPPEERKKSIGIVAKEPLAETKMSPELPDVVLRKPNGNNNKFNVFSRTISLTTAKTTSDIIVDKFQKQNSLNERPKTEVPASNEKIIGKTWMTSMKQKEAEIIEAAEKIPLKDDLSDIVQKSDFINEDFPVKKNFNQRKAEWEQRAQQALKKNTP